jgi:hypothetical protein
MQRKTVGVFIGLALFIVAAGAAGYWFLGRQNLADLINGGPGNASVATRTAQAIAAASRQFDDVQRPDVAVRLSEPVLQSILAAFKDKLHEGGIEEATLSLARQRIELAGKVALTLSDVPTVGDLRIEGHVDGAAAVTFSDRGLLIAPAFERVVVDKAAVRHGADLSVILPAINAGLSVFLTRLNGSLTALGPRLIDLGAGPIWDPGAVTAVGSGVHGAGIPKFWLDRSALLIDENGIRALGAFAYQAEPPRRQPVKPPQQIADKVKHSTAGGARHFLRPRLIAHPRLPSGRDLLPRLLAPVGRRPIRTPAAGRPYLRRLTIWARSTGPPLPSACRWRP